MPKRTLLLALIVLFGCITSVAYSRSVSDPKINIDSITFRDNNNLTIYNRSWVPSTDIKAVCVILHGTAFHSGAYDDLGKFLASNGYATYGTDLQGWGQSQGLARNGYVPSYDDYVDDVSQISKELKKQYPGKKIFVIGENIGAIVPLYGQMKNRLDFDGFVLSGAFHKPNPKFIFRMPGWAANITRKFGLFGAGLFPFQKWGLIPTFAYMRFTTKDKSVRKDFKQDPYITKKWMPVAWAKNALEADRYVDENLSSIKSPMLLLHGEKDAIVPIRSSEEIYDKVSSHDKELKIIRDSGNATFLDGPRNDAMQNVKIWLDDRCAG